MTIKYKIKLNFNNFEPKVFLNISKLKSEIIKIDRFGASEPLKHRFPNDEKKLTEIWDEYLSILFKNKSLFSFYAMTDTDGIISCTGRIRADSYFSKEVNSLIRFIELFNSQNELLYAFFIDEDSYDIKHKVTDEFSYGWEGTSDADFLKFLPGMYWYNAFGEDYIDAIGKEKLSSLKNVNYSSNNEKLVSFNLGQKFKTQESILERTSEMEDLVGGDYFFKKGGNKSLKEHPGGFGKFLETLKI